MKWLKLVNIKTVKVNFMQLLGEFMAISCLIFPHSERKLPDKFLCECVFVVNNIHDVQITFLAAVLALFFT